MNDNDFGRLTHYAHVAQAAWQDHAAAQILHAFAEASIPVIVFKGLTLRTRIYRNPEQRRAGDIDMLVRRTDWERANVLLRSFKYEVSPDEHLWTANFAREFMGELPYRKGTIVIDLHWHPVAMSWFRSTTAFDLAGLWARALVTEVAGVPALRFGPEDELIHLCYHTAIHHALTHPHGYRDILGVLHTEQDNLDWTVLTERARKWRISVAVWAALSVAREKSKRYMAHSAMHGGEIPVAGLSALKVPRWRQWMLRPFLQRAVEGRATLVSGSMRFLGVLLVDRMRDLPGVILRGLFPGRRWLQLRYDLSTRQAFWRQFTYPFEVFTRGMGAVVRAITFHS